MRLFALAALLFLLTGCAEFMQQTILLRYDQATDTVHARLIYHGIYSESSKKKQIDKAVGQLKKVVDRGTRFYLFDNWPLEADIGPPEEGEKDKPGNALLRPHTKVKNGRFCLDGQGRLCAWQDLEIKEVSKLLKQTNQLMAMAILAGKVDPYKDADAETRKLLGQSMAKQKPFLSCGPKGLTFRAPASDADMARLKRGFLETLVKEVEKRAKHAQEVNAAGGEVDPRRVDSLASMLQFLAGNRIDLRHELGAMSLRLPADGNGVVRLNWWNTGTYEPNLLKPAAQGDPLPKLPLPIDPKVTPDKLIAEFMKPPAKEK